MKVAFATLGCRVNFYESEAMAEKFIREGYEVVDFDTFADVYVINTCTVTNMGDKKSRQIISRARRSNHKTFPKRRSDISGSRKRYGRNYEWTGNTGSDVFLSHGTFHEGRND